MTKIRILAISLVLALSGLNTFATEEPVTKTLVWPDGTRYVGGVVEGKRSGKGTIFWQDGTRFVGQFEDDMRNGPGTMILPDGTVYTGFFKDDELVDTEATIASSNAEDSVELAAEETAAALEDTDLPMEADSVSTIAQVDEYDVIEQQPAEEDDYPSIVEEPEEMVEDAIAEVSEPEDTYNSSTSFVEDDYGSDDPYSNDVTEVTEAVKDQLIETVDLWAAAWSDQNVVQYLDNYSGDFAVPSNQSRRTWEALRRSRLTRPSYINLDIDYQRFELVETNVVDVFFRQTYRSNTYSDLTDKVLRMQKEDNDWKILIERSR